MTIRQYLMWTLLIASANVAVWFCMDVVLWQIETAHVYIAEWTASACGANGALVLANILRRVES